MEDDTRLSPADESTLRYLRNQVDQLSERQYRRDAEPDVRNKYWYAREELKNFVSRLRQEGKKI
jgi:hypothetical protein